MCYAAIESCCKPLLGYRQFQLKDVLNIMEGYSLTKESGFKPNEIPAMLRHSYSVLPLEVLISNQ